MTAHVLYEELTPTEFRARVAEAPIAYLPLGTLEWHGEHLPLGSDGIQSREFFRRLAVEVGGVVLPMLFVGPDMHLEKDGQDFYGMDMLGFLGQEPRRLEGSAYRVADALFADLLKNILRLLKRAGFRIVVAHGHGPSTQCFNEHADAWSAELGLTLFSCWRTPAEEMDGLGVQTDHAGANETSIMMAVRPDLVHMEYLDADPEVAPVAVDGGDPRTDASAAKGEEILFMQGKRMAGLLCDAIKGFDD